MSRIEKIYPPGSKFVSKHGLSILTKLREDIDGMSRTAYYNLVVIEHGNRLAKEISISTTMDDAPDYHLTFDEVRRIYPDIEPVETQCQQDYIEYGTLFSGDSSTFVLSQLSSTEDGVVAGLVNTHNGEVLKLVTFEFDTISGTRFPRDLTEELTRGLPLNEIPRVRSSW
jgi:hypothetical protein